jgi:YbbR domain-containing protein
MDEQAFADIQNLTGGKVSIDLELKILPDTLHVIVY